MTSKGGLREFQEELARKLSGLRDAEGSGASRSLMGFQSAGQLWLVDLTDSGEVLPVPPITEVPLTRAWFSGLANVRGMLYTVVDFAAFQGAGASRLTPDSRVLLPHARYGINAALLVDKILGLRSAEDYEQVDDGEMGAPAWGLCKLSDRQGHHWRRLDPKPLFADGAFLDVGL